MQKKKEIEINGQKVTAKELSNRQWKELYEKFGELFSPESVPANQVGEYAEHLIEQSFEGLSVESFLDLFPSDTSLLYDAWREANSAFFSGAQKMGLNQFMTNVKGVIGPALLKDLAKSLQG